MVQVVDRQSDEMRSLVQAQRQFFNTGQPRQVSFRLTQLQRLQQAVRDYEAALLDALNTDLRKPAFEAYASELGGALTEIAYAMRHLPTWVKPQRVAVPLAQQPGRAQIYPEPLGVVLIIAPWNYPVQLVLLPLVGAIAAGNCAILKPSEFVPATSAVIADLIRATFDPAYVAVVEGDVSTAQALLQQKVDHIFFTGSTTVGRSVMAAAAQHLTPVTLELGGKSPCIVDVDVPLEHTARRIIWGKFFNTGQTCVAPDYLLVDRRIHAALLTEMKRTLHQLYGEDPAASPDYGRIVSVSHVQRLARLLQGETPWVGGTWDEGDRYFAPTILEPSSLDAPVMQEEIFGPILPVLAYDSVAEAIALIQARPKPLALYLFSRNSDLQRQVLQTIPSGSVAINDTIMQAGMVGLPFGGVGDSGMGRYHGKFSFDTFSHFKSVYQRSFWLDPTLRYAPYGEKFGLLKRLMG